MARLVDNITLLPRPYKEKEDTVILRVTEKDIEEALPETVYIKKQRKRKRKSNQYYLRYHSSIRHYFKLYNKLRKAST